ncbi:unnamed protein product [Prunus brigantina]
MLAYSKFSLWRSYTYRFRLSSHMEASLTPIMLNGLVCIGPLVTPTCYPLCWCSLSITLVWF